MKRPENFRKLDDIKFTTKTGNTYKFATSDMHPELWVFQQPDNTNYALAFIIDWENNTYEIKRAKNGDGTNWIDTLFGGNFTSQPIKTMNSFVDWVHNRVIQFEYYYDKL